MSWSCLMSRQLNQSPQQRSPAACLHTLNIITVRANSLSLRVVNLIRFIICCFFHIYSSAMRSLRPANSYESSSHISSRLITDDRNESLCFLLSGDCFSWVFCKRFNLSSEGSQHLVIREANIAYDQSKTGLEMLTKTTN